MNELLLNGVFLQVISAIIIIALFIYEFSKDQEPIKISDLTTIALLAVLTAILNKVIAIKIPPQAPVLVISVAATISVLIGLMYKPKLALIAGLVCDITGLILALMVFEVSMPFLGFTLNAVLACYIPAKLIIYLSKYSAKSISKFNLIILLTLNALFILFIFSSTAINIEQLNVTLTLSNKFLIIIIVFSLSILLYLMDYFIKKGFKDNKLTTLIPYITLIMMVTRITIIFLTSLWINVLYQVPYFVGVMQRLTTNLLSMPIQIILIILLLNLIPARYLSNLNVIINKNNEKH
ncbi:MAG: hypothetical protein ACRCTA_07100 [Bacilli bacterium]